MTRRVYYLAAALLLLGAVVRAEDDETTTTMEPMEDLEDEEVKEYYPEAWTKINFKPIIDNERLYKKYKQCLLSDHPTACPRDILELKTFIPEAIETMCAKCLPAHIDRLKEAVAYICLKRKGDYDEVLKLKDTTGELKAKFEEKFGSISCE